MTRKEKAEKLPTYEVEFIPAERRLRQRRGDPRSPFPGDRRNAPRRKGDDPAPEGGAADDTDKSGSKN
jgi:hypothetical protein